MVPPTPVNLISKPPPTPQMTRIRFPTHRQPTYLCPVLFLFFVYFLFVLFCFCFRFCLVYLYNFLLTQISFSTNNTVGFQIKKK